MEFKLPKKTLDLWKVRLTIGVLLFFGLFSFFCHGYGWFLVVPLIINCLYEFAFFWYLPSLFKTYQIKYINGAVIIESGVFIKITHIMPYTKMIYTQTLTSPLARFFGLKAVTLKAARSRLLIPEIPEAEAERLTTVLAGNEQ